MASSDCGSLARKRGGRGSRRCRGSSGPARPSCSSSARLADQTTSETVLGEHGRRTAAAVRPDSAGRAAGPEDIRVREAKASGSSEDSLAGRPARRGSDRRRGPAAGQRRRPPRGRRRRSRPGSRSPDAVGGDSYWPAEVEGHDGECRRAQRCQHRDEVLLAPGEAGDQQGGRVGAGDPPAAPRTGPGRVSSVTAETPGGRSRYGGVLTPGRIGCQAAERVAAADPSHREGRQ